MSLELWLVYLAAAVGLSLTPGPNGLLALTHGARYGLQPTIWTVLGGAFGFLLLIAASLAGLGALLATSGTAFAAAKWAGAAYLIYLGVRLWRSPAPVVLAHASGLPEGGAARPLRLFGDGLFVAVSNPKALLFFAAFLPQFMVAGASFASQFLFLGGTFVVVEVVYELLLAGLAGRIAPWLGRHGRIFNRAAGGTFVGIGAALVTTSR
ncbi:LysE family translocator [Teichococcus vastitatis]|uniref:LysE family translocator n=1 Tax=Teichococcus vastitatis TaxID=2307076 RepID=UPI000E7559C6|nr:LysE family translocator [Pseudoroseomonas vastitatis]